MCLVFLELLLNLLGCFSLWMYQNYYKLLLYNLKIKNYQFVTPSLNRKNFVLLTHRCSLMELISPELVFVGTSNLLELWLLSSFAPVLCRSAASLGVSCINMLWFLKLYFAFLLTQEWVAKFEKPKGDPSSFLKPATTVLSPYLKVVMSFAASWPFILCHRCFLIVLYV